MNSFILCAWLFLLSLLLYKNYTGAALERKQILNELFYKETYWYDVYRDREKIGFAMTSYERAGDEIIIHHEREARVREEKGEKKLISKLRCLTDLFYSIRSFEYTYQYEGERGGSIRGEVSGDDIVFFQETPEMRRTEKITTDGRDIFLPVTIFPVIQKNTPPPQKVHSVSILDLTNLSVNDVLFVLEEIIPIKIGIHRFSLLKFRIGNSHVWTSDRGIVVKEEPPTGLTLYVQNQDVALNPESQVIFDYTALPVLQSNVTIPDSEAVARLRVRIGGIQPDPRLYENSRVRATKNVLTINRESPEDLEGNTYQMPPDEESLRPFLVPDQWVMSDYEPLYDTGQIYARSHDHDAYGFGKYLTGYLYGIMQSTSPSFALLRSDHILKSRKGDHLERTILFASYARAGGLPTRLIGGIVYREGYFYFHTWPEIWINTWVPVDPTLMQFPADATHIPLYGGTAEEIVSQARDVRHLTIQVLEAS